MVEFSKREDVERWLKDKPREWAVVIAARAALRAVPALAWALVGDDKISEVGEAESDNILTVFRHVSASWSFARFEAEEPSARLASGIAVFAAHDPVSAALVAARASVYAAAAGSSAEWVGFAGDAVFNSSYATEAAAVAEANSPATDIWAAVSADATELEGGLTFKTRPNELATQSLWPIGAPRSARNNWLKLKRALFDANEDWEVWTDWYEARLRGSSFNEALELARVQIAEEVWQQGPKPVNAHIKELIEQFAPPPPPPPRVTHAELAEVVSPAPSLTPDERLDAGPNVIYDAPTAGPDLPNLPARQRALIQTILSGLPSQAPKHLKVSLENYDNELRARGVQPILGLLKDMAAVIEADIGAPNARREWLEAGLAVAFENFLKNHQLFEKHFPLDPKRDETYARTPVDEAAATGPALSTPFEKVAKATGDAHKAGMTTDDFVKIVAAMTEHVKVVSTLPSSQSQASAANAKLAVPLPTIKPEDRITPDTRHVSATKRAVLTGIGFFVATYNFLGSTASLLSFPQSAELLAALKNAIEALSRFLR